MRSRVPLRPSNSRRKSVLRWRRCRPRVQQRAGHRDNSARQRRRDRIGSSVGKLWRWTMEGRIAPGSMQRTLAGAETIDLARTCTAAVGVPPAGEHHSSNFRPARLNVEIKERIGSVIRSCYRPGAWNQTQFSLWNPRINCATPERMSLLMTPRSPPLSGCQLRIVGLRL